MRVKIEDIAYCLPEQVVTNQELKNDNPDWDIDLIAQRTGVEQRYIVQDGQTALDLAFGACQKLLSKNQNAKEKIDGIIFCTQSQDHIIPFNASILHKLLDLAEGVFAFDLNLACSGYIYGLALARGLIFSGTAKNILLVTADTYSKYINKKDRSVRMLFGDAAAVSWVNLSESSQGIVDISCSTSGKYYDKFIIPAGACRRPKSAETSLDQTDRNGNLRNLENINMDGMGILAFVNSRVPKQIQQLLSRNKLGIDDIDLFVFHQASKLVLDSLQRLLKIRTEKNYRNIRQIGNTVSASIPIALKQAQEEGKVSCGDKVLLSGFGSGLSWGTAFIEI